MSHTPQESPALKYQSHLYPASWHGKVPLRVRMAKTVYPDFPFLATGYFAREGEIYPVYVNSHGAVSAIIETASGSGGLGLRPHEFEIAEWHDQKATEEGKE
ncbi:MAG: hypothetical protein PHQ40_00470 [Anaerolineaceae bacterium]|nr:hypothetical protein [Anaerolineaceae bacterium]MDD5367530.1 hypothetical protein [Anaerolineaceae bacterium]